MAEKRSGRGEKEALKSRIDSLYDIGRPKVVEVKDGKEKPRLAKVFVAPGIFEEFNNFITIQGLNSPGMPFYKLPIVKDKTQKYCSVQFLSADHKHMQQWYYHNGHMFQAIDGVKVPVEEIKNDD